jgi:hypothetical protein
LTLNGLTPVVGTQQFLRVYRAYAVNAGTLGTNQGIINITHNTSTDLIARIQPFNGQTLMALYTVPRGKKITIKRTGKTAGEGKNAVVKFKFRNNGIENPAIRLAGIVDIFQNQVVIDTPYPIDAPEKTDIWLTAQSSAAGTSVSGSINFTLTNA